MLYYLWVQTKPEIAKYFFPLLSAHVGPVIWEQVVPLDEILKDADKDAPLFVDLGGGKGAQCASFRKAIERRFSGRVINQDLSGTISDAPKPDGVEMMVQDVYEEQQIKGWSAPDFDIFNNPL